MQLKKKTLGIQKKKKKKKKKRLAWIKKRILKKEFCTSSGISQEPI